MRHALLEDYLSLADDSSVAILPHVLRLAAEFGIADALAGAGDNADRLAAAVGANPDSLYRLLRVMASVGLVTESEPRFFALTTSGERLRSDAENGVRESILNIDSYRAWLRAGDTLRTGLPVSLYAPQVPADNGFFEHMDIDAKANHAFIRRMRERTARCYAQVTSMVDWSASRLVMDVGGSSGFLLGKILDEAPHLSGVLFDRGAVVSAIEQSGYLCRLADRCCMKTGDFLEKLPPGADIHLMSSVLHDWNDEHAATILARSSEALEPGGRLLIIEMLVPADDSWHPSKWSDLGMMILTGGRERTRAEFEDILSRSGYTTSAIREIPGSYFSLIEAAVTKLSVI